MRYEIPLIALLALSACAQPTPERQFVADAATALGGDSRIQSIKTLVIEGEGTNGNLGQDMTMEAAGQAFRVTGYRRAIDVAAGRMRIEQTRTPNFLYFQGPQPQKQVFGVDGDVAYNVAANGTATRASATVAQTRRADVFHHPVTAVRAAMDQGAKLAPPQTVGGERVMEITAVNGQVFTLSIDAASGLPTRVQTKSDNVSLGDVIVETGFGDYQDLNGLKMPARLTTKTDRYHTAEFRITKQAIDTDAGDLSAPEAAKSATPAAGPPPARVEATEVAKGIWLLGGQSHHSVLVEFSDLATLIEAPQNDVRTLAVIAKARELVPGKRLRYVVNSHHHFDHSGGIRAAISEGLAVITHKANAAFFEEAAKRPHTIAPDALAKNPKPLELEQVDDKVVYKDAVMTMEVYHIAGNPHADTLLMAYFPKERVLVQADAYSPGGDYQPYAANLLENIQKRNLRVDRIVPLHGTIAPYADLVKAAAPQTPPTVPSR
jgi:glyoxylase-like metal-dependent hydrolase (beta-lactamase superfamily II)